MTEDIFKIKTILVGNSGSGKSSIINALINQTFYAAIRSTMGSSFETKDYPFEKFTLSLQIWDTVGQERFHSLSKNFIKGAQIGIIVYDMTSQESFNEIEFWYKELNAYGDENIVIAIAGSKSDLLIKSEINLEDEGRRKAEQLRIRFYITSAKKNTGINEMFEELAKKLASFMDTEVDVRNTIAGHKDLNLEDYNKKLVRNCC